MIAFGACYALALLVPLALGLVISGPAFMKSPPVFDEPCALCEPMRFDNTIRPIAWYLAATLIISFPAFLFLVTKRWPPVLAAVCASAIAWIGGCCLFGFLALT